MILIKILRHQVTGHFCFHILLDLIMQIWKPRATWNGTHKMTMRKSKDSGHQPILTSNHSSTAQQMEMANQNQQPIWQNVKDRTCHSLLDVVQEPKMVLNSIFGVCQTLSKHSSLDQHGKVWLSTAHLFHPLVKAQQLSIHSTVELVL